MCTGGSKDTKAIQMGINIRYMVIILFWVKSRDIFEGAHVNLYGRLHGEFFHMYEQGYNIMHI